MLGFVFLMVVLAVFVILMLISKFDKRCKHIKFSLLKNLYFEVDFEMTKTDVSPNK